MSSTAEPIPHGNGSPIGLPFSDPSVPNVARIYDFLLGGKDNFAADREAAGKLARLIPDGVPAAYQNRRFLQRAVRFLAGEAGIRQFIDIGTGLPTQGNVHEVAHGIAADARVLYVDYDPVVISHAQALLATEPTVVAINRDLRNPDEIISHPALRALIDLERPVAILAVAVLHFIKDDENPYGIVDTLKGAMAPGSYLVLSHVTDDAVSGETKREAQGVYEHATAPVIPRSRDEFAHFFSGLEVIEPGLTDVREWRREQGSVGNARVLIYGGVGRKS
jgi:O-methyltransferase involved in polyketide biosynthesis